MKKSLGKGLGSLIRSNDANYINKDREEQKSKSEAFLVDISPNKEQPRKSFNEEPLNDLAESIKVNGILQPIAVREVGNNKYEIIAGERRWRAAQLAGLTKVPIIVAKATNEKTLELAIMENIQREDLNPIEEALAIKELIEKYSFSQERIVSITGKKRTRIVNILRILDLPVEIQKLIVEEKLTRGHGLALLSFSENTDLIKIAKVIIDKDLSVRQVEKLGRDHKTKVGSKEKKQDIYIENIIKILETKLGSKIKIKGNSINGKIEIEYNSLEELNKIIGQIK
ncbi:ParB/RepB/Spo0J family partition protein [bacterium]|nr:ParB/RepB/Spo0J family partition protein [bacterium]MBT3794849.1 ParB/RepB/Spo0J family partition protein [bacterium]MBT4634296.1 ParB/RepB/Spo0J family partition protein [bacterium]